tara:strand:+ start:1985 stop:3049 length:1065 start_codon:yes stop_codon:yes gene_type:complete
MNGNIIVNKKNLIHNLSEIKKYTKKSKIMSVIKSNGYGHGILEVAAALKDSDAFAVATIKEAAYLRKYNIEKEIVCLQGFSNIEECVYCSQSNIRPVIHCLKQVNIIEEAKLKKPMKVWIKFDTGMNRLGFKEMNLEKLMNKIENKIQPPVGIMTHLACADEENDDFSQKQIELFKNIIKNTEAELSIFNSAGIIKYIEEYHDLGDWVRPGLMLYGVNPCSNDKSLNIKPAMSLTAPVISTKKCKKGERIGYGHTYEFIKDTTIASLGIGYGDGFPRELSNLGKVFFEDNFFNIIGRVSMDILTVDIGDNKVDIGANVELWGDNINIKEVSDLINTIPYELMCGLGERLQRKYI